jgi:hypothetical protein
MTVSFKAHQCSFANSLRVAPSPAAAVPSSAAAVLLWHLLLSFGGRPTPCRYDWLDDSTWHERIESYSRRRAFLPLPSERLDLNRRDKWRPWH